ncbi:LapA family protein [Kitasatospora sp. NPDC059571]|uniref:LapA family protein n=1 Tax=Kitasatospora sp. NPDC059571 TaxID=3346871 RepID=UPI0036AC382A
MTKTSGGTATGAPGGKQRREIAGVPVRVIGIGVLAVLALWFLLANLDNVQIQFWVLTVTAPLWIALLGSLLVGGVLGWLLKGRRSK